MSISEDRQDFEQKAFREAVDALIELKPEDFTPLDTPKAEVKEIEVAPLGYIAVHTTKWVRKSDAVSPYNPTAIVRWTEEGYEVSRRPRTKADGDEPFVVERVPAPEGETLLSPMGDETHEEWRQRVLTQGANRTLTPSRLTWRPAPVGQGFNSIQSSGTFGGFDRNAGVERV